MSKSTKWMGPYIGETIMGSHSPVFYDIHTPVASNNPSGISISGSPGSGKTFCAELLTYMSTLSGKTTVYLDPKADATALLNLQADIGDINIWNLSDDKQVEEGILDPFSLETEPAKQQLLVMELIEAFVGSISAKQRNTLTPIIEDVVKTKEPSLGMVMNKLLSRRNNEEANELGNELKLIRPLPFSRLCFDHYKGNGLKVGKGLTIITLLGLELPDASTTEYTVRDRLGMGIMLLITNYIRNIMKDSEASDAAAEHGKKHMPLPKTIIIDESWAILATKSGRRIISEICRLGRSLNTACILISQNSDDIEKYGITNSISTRFAFRVKTKEEAKKVREAFDLPEDIGIEDAMISEFEQGDCLMKDFNGNIACIHIDAYDRRIVEAFNSNPFGDM